MNFKPRTDDQLAALNANTRIAELTAHPRFSAVTPDLVEAFVRGIGEFAAREFAPLNRRGDIKGARLVDSSVQLPAGFAEAYRAFVESGWNATAAPEIFGGQGLPFSLACCMLENIGTANMAFSLLPMLTLGAIDALHHHGSEEQKASYLPKLISGEWPGTMNLTEPEAGSDVGALRTTAEPIANGEHAGKYRIAGVKIFITWGEHELAENIVHLVLARVRGAPEGSRGISLFVVPKFHVRPDGTPGERNDVRVVGLEHKLGIHASPTCVMLFGDKGECIGELIGHENEGLKAMFTMMNSARVSVGNQGVQIAERALQQAMAYASERIQSPRAGAPAKSPVPIIEHPDVRRMLLRMRAQTEGARALLYYTAGQIDRGALQLAGAQRRADLLVPLLKAWATEIGVEVASLGIQVHGGMGFIEETGAAQHLRDSRIAPIYEGTNGIQAADFVLRKLPMEQGQVFAELMNEIASETVVAAPRLHALTKECSEIARWMLEDASLDDRLAGSVPFLTMAAVAVAGWQLLRQADALGATAPSSQQSQQKAVVATYFNTAITSETLGLTEQARGGSMALYALSAEALAAA